MGKANVLDHQTQCTDSRNLETALGQRVVLPIYDFFHSRVLGAPFAARIIKKSTTNNCIAVIFTQDQVVGARSRPCIPVHFVKDSTSLLDVLIGDEHHADIVVSDSGLGNPVKVAQDDFPKGNETMLTVECNQISTVDRQKAKLLHRTHVGPRKICIQLSECLEFHLPPINKDDD